MADQEVDQQEQQTQEVEAEAREMGWRPKDEFKGADDKWVDAATFVEKGKHVLPIIKETANRLREENRTLQAKQGELTEALADSQKAIKALEKYHQEDVKQKVEKARTDLKAQLVAAKKSGDVEAEVEITDQLTTLNAADAAAGERDTAAAAAGSNTQKPSKKDYTQDPVYKDWVRDNPWFTEDPIKAGIAYQVSANLRADGETVEGRAFLDKITEGVNKELTRLSGGRSAPRKVEGGKGGAGGNGSNGGGKTYADLPADAKAACRSYEQDLVGKNKKYATVAEWHKSYADQYFKDV